MPGAVAASGLMFTLDGVPLLYNGMEAGDQTESGGPALFEPLKILWQIAERRPQFPKFYAATIPLRKTHAAFLSGELEWVRNSDEQHVVTFIRRSKDESFLIAVNLSNTPFRGTVEGVSGQWAPMPLPGSSLASVPDVALDAFGFRVYRQTR
jgi:cyclomaltodextrinase / maltogenic alpha-amylase / neopullulanase